MTSTILTFSGETSVLSANFFPPIELDPNEQWGIALVDFQAYNTITNVVKGENNSFTFCLNKKWFPEAKWQTVSIPEGAYELDELAKEMKYLVYKNTGHIQSIKIKPNVASNTVTIKASFDIDFTPTNSIGRFLGFDAGIIHSTADGTRGGPMNINPHNVVLIDCSISAGAYLNGKNVHTIYGFFPDVGVSYKIIETPTIPIYLPVTVRTINNITLRITDQNDHLLDFRGETITIRLTLKKV